MNRLFNNKFLSLVSRHKNFLFLAAILVFMSLVLYKGYIFGGKLFLFEDFGSDTVRASLPTYVYFFDWFKNGMPLWSDKMGIGTSVLSHGDIVFDPFTYILFILGRNGIIYMFVYMVIAKIILAGLFFWMFLGKYKLSPYAKIIGAITYSFGGYMIVMGQNYVFGTIYVYLPLILLGFEMWLQDRQRWLLILMLTATALYFYYFFYMTAIFLGIYAIFRYLTLYNFRLKHFLNYISRLAGYLVLTLGLSAFYWLPLVTMTSNNLRVSLSLPSFANMFFPEIRAIVTGFGRFFGYDVFGGPINYSGYVADYYQLALFFGIITILLVPQVLCEENRKKKLAYSIFSISLLLLLFIPFFAHVFNGFADFTYRWTYILNFSLALFLSIAIDNVYVKMKCSLKLLFATTGVLFVISLLVLFGIALMESSSGFSLRTKVDVSKFMIALSESFNNYGMFKDALLKNFRLFFKAYIFIIAYTILTILFYQTKYKNVVKILVLALICVELVWLPTHFINDRLTTNPDPIKNKLGYFDATNEAVSYLKGIDSSIYRIDKSYDSVISEYGNTPSDNDALVQQYRGLKSYSGNNQPNYIRFLWNSGIFVKYPNWAPLTSTQPQDIRDANLNYINGVGDRYLLQSFLGVKYYLTKTPAVLPDYYHYITTIDGVILYKNDNYLPLSFTFDSFITQDEFMKFNNSEKDIALLSFVVVDDKNELLDMLSESSSKALSDNTSKTDISNLIRERRKNSLQIISYKEDNIVGKIDIAENKVLVLTIPYDDGWTLYVDGYKNTLLKVDGGLIGVKLYSGKHTVELKYFPPKMQLGIIISIIALLLFALLIRYEKNLLKGKALINKQSMQFYNKNLRKPYNKLATLILKRISIIVGQFRSSIKKYIFYTTTILGILAFILSGLITRGHSFYNLFNPDKTNHFMDFFNSLYSVVNGPYSIGSIYPPLPHLLYRLMLRLVPYDIARQGALAIRSSQIGQVVLLLYMLTTLFLFFVLIMEIKKGLRIEKYIFTFVMLFSAPFIFQFERANIIFVALLFSMVFVFFKDSNNRIVREFAIVSLAISAGIKLYPAILGLLLLKERRFKEVFRLLFYGLAVFIIPFFAFGGINQITVFLKNLFFTSNAFIELGLGYSVSIQNIIRIYFGLLGDFSNGPIVIGSIFSLILLVLGIFSSFFLRSKWKSVALLCLLMIMVPAISYEYVLIFMIIPLIMFLDSKEKESLDYVYLACFILILLPFTLSGVNIINSRFINDAFPLAYGVLIQNITISTMVVCLIIQGLMTEKPKSVLKSVGVFLFVFILKIFGMNKPQSFKSYVLIAGKILLIFSITLIIFGDNIFSVFYQFKKPQNTSLEVRIIRNQYYTYIYNIEPYYVHHGDKVVIAGENFNWKDNKRMKIMTNYGEIKPNFWMRDKFIFTIPLEWKTGKIVIWAETPVMDEGKRSSNSIELQLLNRVGDFNEDDIKYFAQIKYLNKEARDINNFKNYKLREYKFSRWIPTKAFQLYADIIELITKIK